MEFYKEKGVYLMGILFLIWVIISSFWYVCGVKGFCQNEKKNENLIRNKKTEEPMIIKKTKTTKKVTTEKIIECNTYLDTELKKNDIKNSQEVQKLQIFLNDFEGENLDVDGVYGLTTVEAVKRFQEKNNERIDIVSGYVGKQTRNEINSDYCVFEFNKINNSKIKK